VKIYLVPNTSSIYDRTQLKALAAGFGFSSGDVYVFESPIKQHHSDYNATQFEKAGLNERTLYEKIDSDVLLEVNRLRSKYLKKSVRHISWFQDVRPSDYLEIKKYIKRMHPNDIIYLLGDKKHFGFSASLEKVNCLLSGVNQRDISPGHLVARQYDYDLNLLGYFSSFKERPPMFFVKSRGAIFLKEFLRRPKSLLAFLFNNNSHHVYLDKFLFDKFFVANEIKIKEKYAPLTGHLFEPELKEIKNNIDKIIYDYLYIELPRKLDRSLLFKKIEALHYRNKKIIIAGLNWPEAFPSVPFVRGHVNIPDQIYKTSKITIHNNTHGLGIHSRVLDSMAVGGFVMMHSSPHSRLPGGMDSTFEPDVNYGLYSADNFVEKVEEWLADEDRRKKAISENKKILLSKHLWEHRAEQILRDLR
jgi:hypothetical protein